MNYTHIARRPRITRCEQETRRQADDRIIDAARDVLMRRLGETPGPALGSPATVRDYLCLTLATLDQEEFWCIWLDAQHRVIAAQALFSGTLTQTSVYPREVVKAALTANAAAVIFAHNHPSGVAEPSSADEMLTRTLKQALSLVDVRTLDHFIVAGASATSLAERGLL